MRRSTVALGRHAALIVGAAFVVLPVPLDVHDVAAVAR